MNANSIFQIGKDHLVCEDYAIAGSLSDKISYAIVCDGCSASPDVDFGARVLAMSARITLREYPQHISGEFTPKNFGEVSIFNARRIYNILDIHPQALDATLLIAWVEDGKLTVYMYGDGVFVHKTKNGINTVHIQLSSGAPDYLSYHLNPTRKLSYDKIEGNEKKITIQMGTQDLIVTTVGTPFEPYTLTVPTESGDVISVITDGINSFRRHDNSIIEWKDLVSEFTGFKTTEGEFVVRRISAFKRKCLLDGTVHTDDISIASIVV